jgi:hypothetical protein
MIRMNEIKTKERNENKERYNIDVIVTFHYDGVEQFRVNGTR